MQRDPDRLPMSGYSRVLLVLASLYAIPYVYLFICSFVPSLRGPYADGVFAFDTVDTGRMIFSLLFAGFAVGLFTSWRNEGLGGLIFIVWWFGTWFLGRFAPDHEQWGAAVMGIPVLILGVLLILPWYKDRVKSVSAHTN